MVDEFILRILNTVQSISVNRLTRFFGFEGRDLSIAISDLQARGVVVLEADTLILHASSQELFRTSSYCSIESNAAIRYISFKRNI
ncbi:hypothetical protein SAMN04515618_1204 [Collimonas sp. OK307]|nr:hypothetical protein SAMN04515618_1204 [Collimonas sp. OK307]